ncbi:MAG: ATP-binding protein [Methanomicrobiales archaeon]|nr:ATP-binding protein [Methanomicrobiales archaeon]MDI6875928.1 ATP-binding protein [Methanomicrobiales archaeon]
MKQLAVISGKGGTGKTVITAALATVLPCSKVMADCDVDASNLELLLNPTVISTRSFYGMQCAAIDPGLCAGCGECAEICRFDAIVQNRDVYSVNPVRCEGCAVCTVVCPQQAITLQPRVAGAIYYSDTEWGPLSHARLEPGAGTSGLLVAEVKRQAIGEAGDRDLLLIDGPPGIGCPLISTISGADAVILATEPSVSALHDMERAVQVCRGFGVDTSVIVNKHTLDEAIANRIEGYCREQGLGILGRIPYDGQVIESIRHRRPVTLQDSPAASALREIGAAVAERLQDL